MKSPISQRKIQEKFTIRFFYVIGYRKLTNLNLVLIYRFFYLVFSGVEIEKFFFMEICLAIDSVGILVYWL
jgi:hypothetical protein